MPDRFFIGGLKPLHSHIKSKQGEGSELIGCNPLLPQLKILIDWGGKVTSAQSCEFQTVLYFYLMLQFRTNVVKMKNGPIYSHNFTVDFFVFDDIDILCILSGWSVVIC